MTIPSTGSRGPLRGEQAVARCASRGPLRGGRVTSVFLMMALPGLLWLVLFRYVPMFGVLLAFKDFRLYGSAFIANLLKSPWAGLSNFTFLFHSQDAWLITRNTIGYNALFILVGTVVSVALAIALSELRAARAAKLYQTLMFLPYFLSWVVVNYLLFSFLSADKGVLNRILVAVGAPRIMWYQAPQYWPAILVMINTWKWSGYNSVIFLAAIVSIDRSLFEAARMDGAGRLAQAWYVTMPFLTPLIVILTILAIGRIFSADFGLFYTVPRNSGPLFPVTNVIDTYVFRGLQVSSNIGMSAAAGVYQSVCGFLLVMGANRLVRRFSPEQALF
jgi:putative aldouronate transport system permease protein